MHLSKSNVLIYFLIQLIRKEIESFENFSIGKILKNNPKFLILTIFIENCFKYSIKFVSNLEYIICLIYNLIILYLK